MTLSTIFLFNNFKGEKKEKKKKEKTKSNVLAYGVFHL